MGRISLLLLVSAIIVTSNSQSCTENDLRLVWGNGPWEGNLQICIGGTWGWVCDNSFGTVDAQVACRQLGFQITGAAYRMWSYYGLGNISTPLLIDGLNCAGNENKLIDCPRPYTVGVVSCLYNEIAGIVCPSGGTCTGNQIRRIRNSNGTPFRGNGRVEMCYNGQWGRVCDDSWGSNDVKVACYELGFTKQRVATYCCSRYYGQGYGPYVYDDVACSSAETSLISCNSRALGSTNCAGSNDAGIGCSGTITSSCTNGDVKLWRPSDGPEYFGLALYCKNSKWTGVCDDSFTCHTARLICEQLGFPGAIYYRGEGYWGYFYSTLGNNGVDHYAWSCSSSHTSLSQCSYYYHSSCNAYHDQFGIMCTPNDQKSECTTGTVRLVNGTSSNNGRVEYCFDGGWVSLCGLSAPASTAVCRTLGFNTSFASVYNDERYGRNNNPSSLSYLNCPKSATHVNQCTAIRKGNGGCWRSVSRCGKEYSVQCYNNYGECTDGSFRLVNGTIEQEGRVEICTNGLWGAVCHGSWNSIDAFVLCRSLGYGGSNPTTYWTSTFGLAIGPAPWKNVLCYGWENTLFDCQKTIYPYDSCPVQNTVGVACKDGCNDGEVRLVGGNFENEGTIQVCYSGRWGQVSEQGWDANGARVVCNQLGYTGGNAVPTIGSSYGKSNLTIHLKFVSCSGNELNIDLCSKTKLSLNKGKLELATAQVAGVDCIYDVPTDPPCIATPPLYNTLGNQCGAAQNRTVRINPDDDPSTGNGRVQYCYNGYWSPFCNMDPTTASIACNDLGYPAYSWASIIDNGNYATENLMNISLFDRVSCTGAESSISQCTLIPSSPSCTPYCSTNLGLRCFNPALPSNQCSPEGSLRLADGVIDNEGRVEVCVNGVWGAVCDQGFDKTDAHVVCQQLGHPELEPYVFTNSTFGSGQFPIVYSNLGCVGYENSLGACQKQTYPNTTCSRNNVAGVLCGYDCTNGDIRLVGSQWNYEGTVEICFDNLWGLISDSAWTLTTAQVICQQLGYQAEGTLAVRGSQYGKPNNLTIHFRNVTCNGDEATFSDCSYSTLSLAQGKALLATDDVAGVKCYTPDQCVPPPSATGGECTSGGIRQRGGQGGIPEGNLEFCYRGYWSPFCYLGPTEATVACRQLGYSSYDLTVIFSDGRFGSISNTSLFQNITCESNPSAGLLSDCQVIDTCQSSCPNAIGLRCYESGNCIEGSVRLVNGTFTTEGRVEVCSNGIWGTICANNFTAIDAYVICKELGYGLLEPTVYNNSYYGDGDGSIIISELDCKGYEPTVLDCAKKDYGSFTCSRSNIIGIVCQENCQDGDIQLSGGTTNTQGTVQYCYYNTWGLISDNSWNDNAAKVVCSQLGHTGGTAVRGSVYGKPNRTIVLSSVDCGGTENSLQDCQSSILSPDDGRTLYPHVGVAGVMCVDSTPAPTSDGNSAVVSSNGAAVGLAVVMIFLILIILATIGMILYVFFMRQKVIKTNAVLNEPRVKMSGLGDTGVNNPMVGLDEEGLEDFNTADQDELVDRLNKM